ncbi:unnamed protein product [Cunninghamella blakesleeana]
MSKKFQDLPKDKKDEYINQFLKEVKRGERDSMKKNDENDIDLNGLKFKEFLDFLKGSLKKNRNNAFNKNIWDKLTTSRKTYLMDQDNIKIFNGKIHRISGLTIKNGIATIENEYYEKITGEDYGTKDYHIYKFVDKNNKN